MSDPPTNRLDPDAPGEVVAALLPTDPDATEEPVELIRYPDAHQDAGAVRFWHLSDPHVEEPATAWTDMDFGLWRNVTVAFGLWEQCGPFQVPESASNAVPVEVATHSKAAIAAWLKIGTGYSLARSVVADKMDVSEQTVSNYLSEIRFQPN